MDGSTLDILSRATTAISRAPAKDALVQAVARGFADLGFASFSLSCHKADKHDLALDPTLSTWPAAFIAEYERRNWADWNPNLARAAAAEEAFAWNLDKRYRNRREQAYIDFLTSTPLKGGLSIPLSRRPGRLSCASVESHAAVTFSRETLHAVTVVANTAQMKAELLGLCPEVSIDESHHLHALSPQQAEILKWVAEGKSNADIALITRLSARVVKYHMSEILRKLGVATRSQAAALYVNAG